MDKEKDKSEWFIPAGVLIGTGLGLLTFTITPGAMPGFVLIGLGIGFAASAIFSRKAK